MGSYTDESAKRMQIDIDYARGYTPIMCASCEGCDVDDPAEADEPAVVRRHYGGWASPLEGWVDLSDDSTQRWLVPMCSECAAMQRAENAADLAEETEQGREDARLMAERGTK